VATVGIIFMILGPVLELSPKPPGDDLPPDAAPAVREYTAWLARDFTPERKILEAIREQLSGGAVIETLPKSNIPFDPNYSYVCVTLFQPPSQPLRFISIKDSFVNTVRHVANKLSERNRFGQFDVADPGKCRIMLEVITALEPIDINELSENSIDVNRFEPGITGFRYDYEGRSNFYMPTDAVVYSHLAIRQTLNFIAKKLGLGQFTDRISERIELLKGMPIGWFRTQGVAFITYGEKVLPLYRGYPMPIQYSSGRIYETAKASIDWVLDNVSEDGKFLYYYEGTEDTVIDHLHPNRSEEDNYYNMLRHNGGIIALLKMYEFEKDRRYLVAADKALQFLIGQIRQHNFEGRDAYYVFFNSKAKLGGTGTALVAFLRYRQACGDTKHDQIIHGLAQHILSRICEDGEMIGYYIHPRYNQGEPITEPSDEEKKELFSFYYPGEALLGLALYDKLMPLSPADRQRVRTDAERALNFLVEIRPDKYAELFEPLPSDGWLMQAIEVWAESEQFRKPGYIDFVFNDANAMISHMYTDRDALYYDYPGAFYYQYGDHAYPDGARGEGLIAAYYLARNLGRDDLAEHYLESCNRVAESVMYLYNSDESTYMYKIPEKSIGSFRFKLTRQWVRVDSVQHAACFYLRLYPALNSHKNVP
jgi:hypothetical protein